MLTRIRARASVPRTDLAAEGDVSPCRPPPVVDGPSSGFCMSQAPAEIRRTAAGPRAASRGVRRRRPSHWAESRQRRPDAQQRHPTGKAGLHAATNDGVHFAATTDTASTSAPATLSYPGFLVPGTLPNSVTEQAHGLSAGGGRGLTGSPDRGDGAGQKQDTDAHERDAKKFRHQPPAGTDGLLEQRRQPTRAPPPAAAPRSGSGPGTAPRPAVHTWSSTQPCAAGPSSSRVASLTCRRRPSRQS